MARMCYRLRREIEDLFPPPTTPAERLIGLEIAEFGKLTTRISRISMPSLCSRTGLRERGVNESLTRLKRRGLEFRIIIGYDRNGTPVYSSRGIQTQYRVPGPDEFKNAWELSEGHALALPSGPWLHIT